MLKLRKTYCPNVLTISGIGRNVGKTTLACSIINKMKWEKKVTAIKISSHFHSVDYKKNIVEKPGKYVIYQEDRIDRGKDSSKMLAAGAGKVFFIQTKDEYIREVWEVLSALLNSETPVIIESGGIHEMICPGVSLLITKTKHNKQKASNRAEVTEVIPDKENFESTINKISYSDGSWKF